MSAVRDHYHTIQLVKQPNERAIRFGYTQDAITWDVQVYCSLTRETRILANFKEEADAVDFAHEKAIELEIAWERLT